MREKRAGAGVMFEQREHLGAHLGIVGGLAADPWDDGRWIVIDGSLEQIADAARLFRRHAWLNSRNNHARASAQRRFSVAGDIPSAAAVSSMLSPAK